MTVETIRSLYNAVADHYETDIAPLVGPLARNLIDSIPEECLEKRALDVGTGTGLAARRLIERGAQIVIGIDIAGSMLHQAVVMPSMGFHSILADVCQPPFSNESFDLIVASFGLSLTAPRKALSQIRALLRPGGWLYFQEWAAQDALSQAFDEAFACHITDRLMAECKADLPTAWTDRLQDSDDYREYLAAIGFSGVQATESAPVSVRTSVEAFASYKLAWPTYRAIWRALDSTTRAALDMAVRARLADFAAPDGMLTWQPPLFRVSARR